MKTPTKLEAPDGGWGILVCVGMAMPFISGLASLPSFGLVFGDFLKNLGAETSAIAFITSAFFLSFSFSGLFSGSLFTRFGLRAVGLTGGILYFLGSVLQIFVTSTTDLLIAFSLVQGVGFGIIIPTSYTVFNNYFVKQRVVWMSFAQSLIGLGTMIYPVLMQKLIEWYGFRGCLIVLAGINSHAVLGMLLMQPVEWHMRRVPISDEELAELTKPTSQEVVEMAQEAKATDSEEDKSRPSPLVRSTPHSQKHSMQDLRMLSRRASSIRSLGNWSGPIVVSDASKEMTRPRRHSERSVPIREEAEDRLLLKTTWQSIVDFLDLTLLCKPIYVNIVLGTSFALYSDIAFFTLQPLYLFELGFSKSDTASVIAIGAAADLFSRISLAFAAIFIQMPSRYIYLAGTFFTCLARFVFVNVFDFTGMAIVTALMGFLRTWIHVPLPLVFAEYLPEDRFATGYGLFMFLQGNILFAVGPIVGYIRDKTRDYILTFHVINIFMALCAVPWIIEIVCVKFRRKTPILADKK